MTIASQFAQSHLCIKAGEAPYSFDASSERLEILSETLQAKTADTITDGIQGERSELAQNQCVLSTTVGGEIRLQPSPADFDLLLPRILGGAESSDQFLPANALPAFGILIDRGEAIYQYKNCLIDRAMLSGRKGRPIELAITVRATQETTAESFPTLSLATAEASAPYLFQQAELNIDGDVWEMFDFELVIENRLTARFVNSVSATSFLPGVRRVSLRATLPLNSETESRFADQSLAEVAGSLAFQSGDRSTSFAFPELFGRSLSPTAKTPGETKLPLDLVALKGESSEQLVVTNVS